MYKYLFIITILINSPSWAQETTVYKEKETCHTYSDFYSYENYNKGRYDNKTFKNQKSRDEYQRTVIEEGNNITIIEKRKSYDRDVDMPFTYSTQYDIKRTFLENNQYKDEIEFSETLYVGDNSTDSITSEGNRETKIYQVHPDGSKVLIKHVWEDGTEYDVGENIEYTRPDGTKHKIAIFEETRVSKGDDWRRDTLFEMKVCNVERL